jgi:hypothetical protein
MTYTQRFLSGARTSMTFLYVVTRYVLNHGSIVFLKELSESLFSDNTIWSLLMDKFVLNIHTNIHLQSHLYVFTFKISKVIVIYDFHIAGTNLIRPSISAVDDNWQRLVH